MIKRLVMIRSFAFITLGLITYLGACDPKEEPLLDRGYVGSQTIVDLSARREEERTPEPVAAVEEELPYEELNPRFSGKKKGGLGAALRKLFGK